MAAELATHVDRLALCIHPPTSRRPELATALGSLGLPPQSIAVVAARFLAAGEVSVADVRSISRYQPEENIAALVEAHRRRGLLEPIDDRDDVFTPTGGLRDGASMVLALQAEEAARLWMGTADLAPIRDQAHAHVDAAIESPLPLDAFRRQVGAHHALPDTDAGQLLGLITELRYLRSDVHAAALAEEGLSGPTASTLHRLWRGFDPKGAVDTALVERQLVDVGTSGPVITELGMATCERVERATDVGFANVFGAVSDEASDALLAGLRELAGDDPRPIEDR